VFDTVYKEGAYQLRPDATHGGSQALDLQPAQGGFVELTFDENGLYPIVTHKFANVGKGALGLFMPATVWGVPPTWRVFTKKRGRVGAFFRGTSGDPDPLLVVTSDGLVEYVNDKTSLQVVAFQDLAEITLKAQASTMSDSMHAWLTCGSTSATATGAR
jgi:hypothetical protein